MLARFVDFCIGRRGLVVTVIGLLTLLMLGAASRIHVGTDFGDLLPRHHAYVEVHKIGRASCRERV